MFSARWRRPCVRSVRIDSMLSPAAATSTRRSTRAGYWIASSAPMKPPIELPTICALSMSSSVMSASIASA